MKSCFGLFLMVFFLSSFVPGQVTGDYGDHIAQLKSLLEDWKPREDVPEEVRDMITKQAQMLIDMAEGKAPCLGISDALIQTYAEVLAQFMNKLSFPCEGVSSAAYQLGRAIYGASSALSNTAEAAAARAVEHHVDTRISKELEQEPREFCSVAIWDISAGREFLQAPQPFRTDKFSVESLNVHGRPGGGDFEITITAFRSSAQNIIQEHPVFFDREPDWTVTPDPLDPWITGNYTGTTLRDVRLQPPVPDGQYQITIEVIYTPPGMEPCQGTWIIVLQKEKD